MSSMQHAMSLDGSVHFDSDTGSVYYPQDLSLREISNIDEEEEEGDDDGNDNGGNSDYNDNDSSVLSNGTCSVNSFNSGSPCLSPSRKFSFNDENLVNSPVNYNNYSSNSISNNNNNNNVNNNGGGRGNGVSRLTTATASTSAKRISSSSSSTTAVGGAAGKGTMSCLPVSSGSVAVAPSSSYFPTSPLVSGDRGARGGNSNNNTTTGNTGGGLRAQSGTHALPVNNNIISNYNSGNSNSNSNSNSVNCKASRGAGRANNNNTNNNNINANTNTYANSSGNNSSSNSNKKTASYNPVPEEYELSGQNRDAMPYSAGNSKKALSTITNSSSSGHDSEAISNSCKAFPSTHDLRDYSRKDKGKGQDNDRGQGLLSHGKEGEALEQQQQGGGGGLIYYDPVPPATSTRSNMNMVTSSVSSSESASGSISKFDASSNFDMSTYISRTTEQIKQLRLEKADMENQIDDLKNENFKLDLTFKHLNGSRDSEIEGLRSHLENVRKENSALHVEVKHVRQQVASLHSDISSKDMSISELTKRKGETEEFISRINDIVSSSKGRSSNNSLTANSSSSSSSSSDNYLKNISSFINKSVTQVKELKDSNSRKEAEHATAIASTQQQLLKALEENLLCKKTMESLGDLQAQLASVKLSHTSYRSSVAVSIREMKDFFDKMVHDCHLRLKLERGNSADNEKKLLDHIELLKSKLVIAETDIRAEKSQLAHIKSKEARESSSLRDSLYSKELECEAMTDELCRCQNELKLQQTTIASNMRDLEAYKSAQIEMFATLKAAEEKNHYLKQENHSCRENMTRIEQLYEAKCNSKSIDYDAKLNSLNIEVEELRRRVDEQARSAKELEEENILLHQAVGSKDLEAESMRAIVVTLEARLEVEAEQRTALQEEILRVQEEETVGKAALSASVFELATTAKDLDRLQRDLAFEKSENDAMQVKLEHMKGDWADQLREKDSRIKALLGDIEETRTECNLELTRCTHDFSSKLESVVAENSALSATCSQLTSALDSEKANLSTIQSNYDILIGKYENASDSLSSLQDQYASLLTSSSTNDNLLESAMVEIANKNLELAEKLSERDDLEQIISALKEGIDRTNNNLHSKDVLVEDWKRKFEVAEANLKSARDCIEVANTSLSSKDSAILLLERQAETLRMNNLELDNSCNLHVAEIGRLEEKLNEVISSSSNALVVMEKLQKKEIKYLALIEKCQKEMDSLKILNTALEEKQLSMHEERLQLKIKCETWSKDFEKLKQEKTDKINSLEVYCGKMKEQMSTLSENHRLELSKREEIMTEKSSEVSKLLEIIDRQSSDLLQIRSKLGNIDSERSLPEALDALLEEKDFCEQQIANLTELHDALSEQVTAQDESLKQREEDVKSLGLKLESDGMTFEIEKSRLIEEHGTLKQRYDSLIDLSSRQLEAYESMQRKEQECLETIERMHLESQSHLSYVKDLKASIAKLDDTNRHLEAKCENWRRDYEKLMTESAQKLSTSSLNQKQVGDQRVSAEKRCEEVTARLREMEGRLLSLTPSLITITASSKDEGGQTTSDCISSMVDENSTSLSSSSISNSTTKMATSTVHHAQPTTTPSSDDEMKLISENQLLNDHVKELYDLLVAQSEEALVREKEHQDYQKAMEAKVRDVMLLNHQLLEAKAALNTTTNICASIDVNRNSSSCSSSSSSTVTTMTATATTSHITATTSTKDSSLIITEAIANTI